MEISHPDAVLIDRLGGPAHVARLLGFDPKGGGVQRVQNWKTRGIPELIRLRRPDLFSEDAEAARAKVQLEREGRPDATFLQRDPWGRSE